MDANATGLAYDNLRLSKNEIELNVKPINPTVVDRSKMRYYLEIYVPTVKNATTWKLLPVLDAPEEPFEQIGEEYVAKGAYFLINELLHSYLSSLMPIFGQKKIISIDTLVMPFKVKKISKDNGIVIEQTESAIEYVINGGIKEAHLREWEGQLFSDFIGQNRKFLTWNPTSTVLPEQPNYLYFLTNMRPTPTILRLRICRFYSDSTEDISATTFTAIGDVQYMTVYSIPIGATELGLVAETKRVSSYCVWLINQNDEIVSEIKTFHIDWRYYRDKRFIVFRNSFGGYDSLAATGDLLESVNIIRESAERYKPYQALASFSEVEVSKVTAARELTINTNWLSKDQRTWLEELALSEDIYLTTDRGFVPLLLQDSSYVLEDSTERSIGRTFVFAYANTSRNFSTLPVATEKPTRTTAWRAYGFGACQLDSFGKRTGKKHVTLLEKYYVDDASSVQPYVIKPNSSSTEGYISAQTNVDCAITPFFNTAYTAAGKYQKNDCANGQYGDVATITIAANRWGSEVSQADADAKAVAELNAIDTQTYANNYGGCLVLAAGLNAKIWQYFNNVVPDNLDAMGTPDATRIDTTGDLSAVAFPYNDTFAVRWDGFVRGPITGAVTFIAEHDDGVRIWIDDVLILNHWSDNDTSEASMTLAEDVFYKIRIDYYEYYGGLNIVLKWRYAGQTDVVIPAPKLFRIP